jgi:23S rRNA (cytosine1962-C5)-methyltransferase
MANVYLKKGEGRGLNAGSAWVFDNEVERIEGEYVAGDLVSVFAPNGFGLGTGFINPGSKIIIRMLSRRADQPIDDTFIKQRVKIAVEYRTKTIDMSSCRLIFGEADFLPGLVVDKFADVLVVQSLALGIDRFKDLIVTTLKEELSKLGMPIRGVYERSDARVRQQEGMERVKGYLGDEFDPKVQIVENGVKYIVDVEEGQKTGFFLDQKLNRKAIHSLCKDAEVLDCFTHTGSFALNAAIAGAKHVIGVDASDVAINQADENAKLNHMEDRVEFLIDDVFEYLPKLEKNRKKFDVVILDPPAFTKSRASVKNAMKGYKEINLRAMKLIRDGGYLATCSCSHFMTPELFAKCIHDAAHDAKKRLRQVEYRTQAPDHPILWAAEESYYLKFFIFQVVDEK